eukprot:COSAG03_NODE_1613_length_3771_cov_3.744281_6_plen_48_part_00
MCAFVCSANVVVLHIDYTESLLHLFVRAAVNDTANIIDGDGCLGDVC